MIRRALPDLDQAPEAQAYDALAAWVTAALLIALAVCAFLGVTLTIQILGMIAEAETFAAPPPAAGAVPPASSSLPGAHH